VGAALTTTGRVGTTRRFGSGKQDGKVYESRNQWSNPLKSRTGSNLVDMGHREDGRADSCPAVRGRTVKSPTEASLSTKHHRIAQCHIAAFVVDLGWMTGR
jgi:hypothetical protein